MKSRSELWIAALEEFGAVCPASTAADIKTMSRRVEHEGDSFFTVTLPSYARDLEEALSRGGISTDLFSGFSRAQFNVLVGNKMKKFPHAGVPMFLGGFMDIVFSSTWRMTWDEYSAYQSAGVRPVPLMRSFPEDDDAEIATVAYAIYAMRQLCLMFSKEKELCSDNLVEKAIQEYVTLDGNLTAPLRTSERPTSLRAVVSLQSERS